MYNSIDEFKTAMISSAKERLFFMQNINRDGNEVNAVLSNLCEKGIQIIKQWRKLKTDDELLYQKWDSQLTDYIVDSYNALNEENYSSSNVGGTSRTYNMPPESALKSKIPQRLF